MPKSHASPLPLRRCLLKYWILGGKRDDHWRARWELATDDTLRHLRLTTYDGGLTLIGDGVGGGGVSPHVSHLSCWWGGAVALGVMHGAVTGAKAERYAAAAAGMTRVCYRMYEAAPFGLASDHIWVDLKEGTLVTNSLVYMQRPEVVESIFYLYRLTGTRRTATGPGRSSRRSRRTSGRAQVGVAPLCMLLYLVCLLCLPSSCCLWSLTAPGRAGAARRVLGGVERLSRGAAPRQPAADLVHGRNYKVSLPHLPAAGGAAAGRVCLLDRGPPLSGPGQLTRVGSHL